MLKVFEAFAGIGSQTQALKNIGIEHEVVAISEIDKYAIASYEAIHGKTKNLGDISQLKDKDIPEHDLFTYSFPCQDISLAGKQKGLNKNSETRSSLLWECERIINIARPKYLLLENVKNLVSKKHKHNFDEWLKILENYGYKNYWQILNAKDYGVPQNRERVFVVSVRNDIDCNFKFPEKQELKYCLKDFLEHKVDDKFYLKKEMQERFIYKPVGENIIGTTNAKKPSRQTDLIYNSQNNIGCLMATDYKNPKKIIEYYTDKTNDVKNIFKGKTGKSWQYEQCIYDSMGISRALKAGGGSGNIPKVLVKNNDYEIKIKANNKKGYTTHKDGASISLEHPNSEIKHTRATNDISRTLTTCPDKGVLEVNEQNYRIRKLTPKECWRLMGFKDEQFNKAKQVCSNTQLYKQAGNSIVVNVLEQIFSQLFINKKES